MYVPTKTKISLHFTCNTTILRRSRDEELKSGGSRKPGPLSLPSVANLQYMEE